MMPMRLPAGALLIFAAAVLWGLDGVLRRHLFGLPAVTIVFYEHLIGAILLAPFVLRLWGRERLLPREWGALGFVALFSGVLGTLFFTAALLQVAFISFSVVFLVQKLQPVFAIAMGALILRERPTPRYFGWAGLALVAGYFTTFPYGVVNMGADGAYLLAALYAFLAAVLWGSSTALSRYTLIGHSQTFVTGVRFLLTVPFALFFVLVLGHADSLVAVRPSQFFTLLLIACSTGMAALWIYYRGLRTTSVRVSAIVELAFPATAVALDYALYGTMLAWAQYAAALVLLFAMYRVAANDSSGRA